MTNFPNRTPLVSVIIPTRNCLAYLPAAISSVLMQTISELEIVVVDDGSTDGTAAWLAAESKKDPRIRSLCLVGGGVSAARNAALGECRSALVAFLDADDTWHAGKLDRQVAFHLANPSVVMSFSNYVHVNPRGDNLGDCFAYWPQFRRLSERQHGGFGRLPEAAARLYAENVVGTSTVLARRDALQNANGFDERLQSASDWDLWLKLALIGEVGYSSEILTTYLVRPGSISSRALLRLQTMEQIIARYRTQIGRNSTRSLRTAHARLASGYGEYFRNQNRPIDAFFAHLRGWRLAPSWRLARAVVGDAWQVLQSHSRQ